MEPIHSSLKDGAENIVNTTFKPLSHQKHKPDVFLQHGI